MHLLFSRLGCIEKKAPQKVSQSFHKHINLYSLNFFSHHNWILFSDFCCSFCFVIIRAVMLVRVTVKSTKQVSTSAVKSCTQKKKQHYQEDQFLIKVLIKGAVNTKGICLSTMTYRLRKINGITKFVNCKEADKFNRTHFVKFNLARCN